ncbi:MAG: nitrilase family protein [Bacteroidia bacterium]|nr:nitrilase family protein [Bacteroidia bacterium]
MKTYLVQFDIVWENPEKNIEKLNRLIPFPEKGSVVVLPEMWSTGFTMMPEKLAEKAFDGPGFRWMKEKAKEWESLVAGSLAVMEPDGKYKNRFYAVYPDGKFVFYDKKHLFSLAGENRHYHSGDSHLLFNHEGWYFSAQICYDIRFPVWCRNRKKPGLDSLMYDVMLVVANWPESRSYPWRQLLIARAIENQSYVVAVNRVGPDGNGISHSGNSMVISPFGEVLAECKNGKEEVLISELDKTLLEKCRSAFPFWKDADNFHL